MLTGFSLVFCIAVGFLFLFLGIIWDNTDALNLLIQMVNFILVFASAYVADRCTHFPVWYLCVIGLWSLVGGILWKTTSPLNILLKTILLSTSILSFSIIY